MADWRYWCKRLSQYVLSDIHWVAEWCGEVACCIATAVGVVGVVLLSAESCVLCCCWYDCAAVVELKLVNFDSANIHRYLSRSYLMQLQILE